MGADKDLPPGTLAVWGSTVSGTDVGDGWIKVEVTRMVQADAEQDEATGASGPGPSLPDATEEVWQRRIQSRHDAVAIIKESPEYQSFTSYKAEAERRGIVVPRTPDATDRSVSKRRWESKALQWRTGLRQWSQAEGS